MSSSDIAVSVRGLCKSYTIAHDQEKHSTLAETILSRMKNPLRRPKTETFWALKDVSFEIKKGDVVGIIGRNGAGKSTLLKILSRITQPTSGEVDIYGRVGSLLEVGTGFHPELTGRENVFLNGAILGMSKAEIRRHFEAIVDFAGVEQFLDTPVKRYSSGMYVRLAFAVAAHLRSEILVVDEVLAVGDVSFQKRCLDKMESVGNSGRTVLFVSHSMSAIARLCKSAILLRNGVSQFSGGIAEATRLYLGDGGRQPAERRWLDAAPAPGDDVCRLRAVRVTNAAGKTLARVTISDAVYIEIEYEQLKDGLAKPLTASVHLINAAGITVFASNDFDNLGWYRSARRVGIVRSRCQIGAHFLAEGAYTVLAAVCSYDPNVVHAIERDAVAFEAVEEAGQVGARAEYAGDWPGVTRPRLNWEAAYAS